MLGLNLAEYVSITIYDIYSLESHQIAVQIICGRSNLGHHSLASHHVRLNSISRPARRNPVANCDLFVFHCALWSINCGGLHRHDKIRPKICDN